MSGKDVALQRLPRNVCGGNVRNCNIRVENAFTGNGDVAMQRLYPVHPTKTVSFKKPDHQPFNHTVSLNLSQFNHEQPFTLESGGVLPRFNLVYATAGTLNAAADNVVCVCHALTGNADPTEWWGGLVGEGKFYNPGEHFIVCANILGSHYGSTGPFSLNPQTNDRYYHDFPFVTIRDMVNAMELLRKHLKINGIHTCIGGSLGGQQALEWAVMQPNLIENLVLMATNAQHSAWGIAFNESQRMAIETDPTWPERRPDAGSNGMKTARAIALLSYRHYDIYTQKQTSPDHNRHDDFPASSYQRYQGEKLAKRFNAFSYWTLSKAMDSHHVGRGRGGAETALRQIRAKTLVLGITTDLLFPVAEQRFLAAHISNATYAEMDSIYGHDGFLIEYEDLNRILRVFYGTSPAKNNRR